MSRARAVLEAEHQVEAERFQCVTCSGVAQEHSDHCIHCEIYWEASRETEEPLGADDGFG